jgi:hypothetical protein
MHCTVEGCEDRVVGRGWCNKHYLRWKNHGSTDTLRPTLYLTAEERFWYYTSKGGPDECWVWSGATDRQGYGKFNMPTLKAHAFSYELHHGPVPDGQVVRHYVCGNPPCVNPAHLRAGSVADNHADRLRHGRSVLTAEQVREVFHAEGPQTAIAERYGISQSFVSLVKRRERWASVTADL